MKFKNRPNQCVWISRSVAVLAIPVFRCNGSAWAPLGLRSQSCPTYKGFYGLPAGYLDWDESASEAMIREVWEELGLDITAFGDPSLGSIEQPYYVFSDPSGDAAQNVTLRFRFTFDVQSLPTLQQSSTEVGHAAWFDLSGAQDMVLAFNHAEILKEVV